MIRWFDDSIVDLKEKKLYFHDSMIRSTIRSTIWKKKFIFSWFDDSTIRSSIWKKKIIFSWFDDSIDDSTIRSTIWKKKIYFFMIRWFDDSIVDLKEKIFIFTIRRIDRRFDDSIDVIKVKIFQNLFWSIRRFNHRIDFWILIVHRWI